jgi:hypothetical protein
MKHFTERWLDCISQRELRFRGGDVDILQGRERDCMEQQFRAGTNLVRERALLAKALDVLRLCDPFVRYEDHPRKVVFALLLLTRTTFSSNGDRYFYSY